MIKRQKGMKRIILTIIPFLPMSFMLVFNFAIQKTEEKEMYQELDEGDDHFIKVAIVEDKAYWVINNVLYQADVVDGEIEKEYAEPVDAFEMDYREVNKLMNILDNMQDWKN
jgi:hypothetical protein